MSATAWLTLAGVIVAGLMGALQVAITVRRDARDRAVTQSEQLRVAILDATEPLRQRIAYLQERNDHLEDELRRQQGGRRD